MSRQYQDEWVNGRAVSRGYRDCEGRYAIVRDALADIPRPFTVFDLGARRGYFSLRLAEDFGATCTAVDYESMLLDTVARNDTDRVSAHVVRISGPADLAPFGAFDVVLALAVLHHLPHVWRDVLDALQGMARRALMVEVPPPGERVQVRDGDRFAGLSEEVAARGERLGSARRVFGGQGERGIYRLPGLA